MSVPFKGCDEESQYLLSKPIPSNGSETVQEASKRPFVRVIGLGLAVSVFTMLGYTKSLMEFAVHQEPDVSAFKVSNELVTPSDFAKLETSKQFLEFKKFATKFNREYSGKDDDDKEVQQRFKNFKVNMDAAVALTASKGAKGNFGVTKFSDYAPDEWTAMKGYVTPGESKDRGEFGEELGLPAYSANHEDYDDVLKPGATEYQKDGAKRLDAILDRVDEKQEHTKDVSKVRKDRDRARAERSKKESSGKKEKGEATVQDAISKVKLTAEQKKKSGAGNMHGLVDWRGVLSTEYIISQGLCMSCWAISAINQLESDAIRNGLMTPAEALSIQAQLSCDTINHGCTGGAPNLAYDYIYLAGGAEANSDYGDGKYHGRENEHLKCEVKDYTNPQEARKKVSAAAYFNLQDEPAMIKHVTNTGPLSVCGDSTCFHHYTSGIISGEDCKGTPNHCFSIVGINHAPEGKDYEGEDLVPYWIVRNSWGDDFGHHGYVYIAVGDDNCRITNAATFVSASKPHAVSTAA